MYLILPDAAAAKQRSAAAYAPLRAPDAPDFAATDAVWAWRLHPEDGRAALDIPATPAGAGLGLSQAAYDGLLTEVERAALVATLPADWDPPPAL